VLSSGFLFDDIYRLGTAFEVRDVLRGFRAKLCFGFLDGLGLFEAENEVCRFVGVLRGAENLILIILKCLDPRPNVGGVLFGVCGVPRSAERKTLASSARNSSLA
jgi:hypothetical protein